jgi:protein-disulfide isomerase
LIRSSARFASAFALIVLSLPAIQAAAQQQVPAEPAAPAPATAPAFPKTDPTNFTAASPSKEVVGAFLSTSWGYDESRIFEVWAIQKTQVEGVSQVTALVGDKTGKQKIAVAKFFVLPDGKHLIAGDEIMPFGEHPYAELRAELQKRADGPHRGSASKDLEIIEFADFQCPHCKVAQANMDKLAVDFPKARIVFQNYPLAQHPAAANAAAYGLCVSKLGGSDAFFTFASAVFDGQDGLASTDGATLTLNSAVTKAALDPAKIAACADTAETKASVEAGIKLAKDININQTPMLIVNGRQVGVGGMPYETLKQIIQYQAKLDGVLQ